MRRVQQGDECRYLLLGCRPMTVKKKPLPPRDFRPEVASHRGLMRVAVSFGLASEPPGYAAAACHSPENRPKRYRLPRFDERAEWCLYPFRSGRDERYAFSSAVGGVILAY